jgi:hypothetical protein
MRRSQRVFEIKLADGALFLGATRLTPQSETVFINSGLAIEFRVGRPGRAHASVRQACLLATTDSIAGSS